MARQNVSSPTRVRLSSKRTWGNADQREQARNAGSPAKTSVVVGSRQSSPVDTVCTRFLPGARAVLAFTLLGAALAAIVTALTLNLANSESPYGGSPELALGAFILVGLVPLAVMLTVATTRPRYLAERRRSGR